MGDLYIIPSILQMRKQRFRGKESLAHSHTDSAQQTGLQAYVSPKHRAYGTILSPTSSSLHSRS